MTDVRQNRLRVMTGPYGTHLPTVGHTTMSDVMHRRPTRPLLATSRPTVMDRSWLFASVAEFGACDALGCKVGTFPGVSWVC
jgi:hypothetical protein